MKEIIERVRKTYRSKGGNGIICEVSYNFEMVDVDEDEMESNMSSDNHNRHFAEISNCTECDIPPRQQHDLRCPVTGDAKSLWKDEIHPQCPIVNNC